MAEMEYRDAGSFSSWLHQTLHSTDGVDVPCGECVACCKSSYFIHITPDETLTIKHIPAELLFPAPGWPKGNLLMGHYDNGHCPMIVDDRCSIYDYRSRTCRNYDCRIFTAAGISAGSDEKKSINQQVCCWKFSYPEAVDRAEHQAVLDAAAFLQEHAGSFPQGVIPRNPTQIAILAIRISHIFLKSNDGSSENGKRISDSEIIESIMKVVQSFNTTDTSSQTNVQK
jgi:Fe-S-cluster containining protein